MNLLDALQSSVAQALVDLFENVLLWIPRLVGAFVVFIFGLLIARVARDLTRLLLNKVDLDRRLNRFNVDAVLKKVSIDLTFSEAFSIGVYWIVLLAFIQSAVGLLGIVFITKFIAIILTYIPELTAALFVFLVGMVVAYYASRAVTKFSKKRYVQKITEGVIIFLTLVIAIDQLGIDVSLINKLIINLVTVVGAAFAIAFGFGGREKAKAIIDKYSKK